MSRVFRADFHAEIKAWKSYKAAVGQLAVYNAEMPKARLVVYLFGECEADLKKTIVDAVLSLNFEAYELCDYLNCVKVRDLRTGAVTEAIAV